MRRLPLLLVLTVLFSGATSTAHAQNSNDYNAVADAFSKLVQQDMMQKKMPTVQDKDAVALIRTLSDDHRFLDSQNYTVQNFLTLTRLCQRASEASVYYIKFDPVRATGPNENLTALPAPKPEQANSNIRMYQDEIVPLMIFNLRCLTKAVPLVSQFYEGLKPDQRSPQYVQGTRLNREGCFSVFMSNLSLVAAAAAGPAITEANAAAFARSLADTARILAPDFTLAERQKILQTAKAAEAAAPTRNKVELDKVVEAMSKTDCQGVCTL